MAVLGFHSGVALADEPSSPASVSISVSEAGTTTPLPSRVHLIDSAGKPVKPEGYPFWHDHFVCDGAARVKLPAGEYRYEIERGPEYSAAKKPLVVKAGEALSVTETLCRIVDLSREGWWSGETHIHRPEGEIPFLMRAEDLHVGVAITWWNDRNAWKGKAPPQQPIIRFDTNRFLDMLGGEDERGGGALLFTHLREPLPIAASKRESPSSARWLAEAKAAGAWVDAEKPFWWDFPLWLASGKLDSIGIANNHMNRSRMLDNEAWGRPRDRERLAGPHGNGLWTQELYYHALNCGFRLPPSAGSASGVLPNPVGYNRVYAHLDGDLTWDKWWEAIRAGRVFVTNGPLMRVKANDRWSGHVFQSEGLIEIPLDGKVDSREPVAAVELVRNGRIDTIRLPARIKIEESGWFLIRAVADVPHTFRFASTGPWYVEIAGQPTRVSRASCEFFLRWTDDRIENLRKAPMSDEERRDVLADHDKSRQFWTDRLSKANPD
jgi:hypothetical protein